MKTVKIVLFSLILFSGTTAVCQTTLDTLRYSDLRWTLRKKAVVLDYMQFTEAEKSSFWPVFESYNNATRYFELESLMMLKKYADGGDFSGSELEDISQRILKNDLQLAKLRKQFYKKFKDAVSAEQATAFFQIDTMFRSMIRLEAQRDFSSNHLARLGTYTRN